MKYLCLCYYAPEVASALSSDSMKTLSAASQPHYEAWEASGRLVVLGGLSDPQAFKTIRPADAPRNVDAQPTVADGPYLRDGHRIGAFFIVEARDIHEAVEIAAKHPTAHTGRFLGGGIEVSSCEGFEIREPAGSAG